MAKYGPPVVMGDDGIMSDKAHGTTENPPQKELKYGVDWKLADNICCYNRHSAEDSGYFMNTDWPKTVDKTKATDYYDSVTGKLLFTAPKGRTVNLSFLYCNIV